MYPRAHLRRLRSGAKPLKVRPLVSLVAVRLPAIPKLVRLLLICSLFQIRLEAAALQFALLLLLLLFENLGAALQIPQLLSLEKWRLRHEVLLVLDELGLKGTGPEFFLLALLLKLFGCLLPLFLEFDTLL